MITENKKLKDIINQSLDDHPIPFQETYWQEAEKLLPQNKLRKRWFYIWVPALLLVVSTTYIVYDMARKDTVSDKTFTGNLPGDKDADATLKLPVNKELDNVDAPTNSQEPINSTLSKVKNEVTTENNVNNAVVPAVNKTIKNLNKQLTEKQDNHKITHEATLIGKQITSKNSVDQNDLNDQTSKITQATNIEKNSGSNNSESINDNIGTPINYGNTKEAINFKTDNALTQTEDAETKIEAQKSSEPLLVTNENKTEVTISDNNPSPSPVAAEIVNKKQLPAKSFALSAVVGAGITPTIASLSKSKSAIGMKAGIQFDYSIGRFCISSGMNMYVKNGYDYAVSTKKKEYSFGSSYAKMEYAPIQNRYIEVPLMIGYKHRRHQMKAGVAYSYLLGTKLQINSETETNTENGRYDFIHAYDLGLMLQYQFKLSGTVSIGINYYKGTKDVINTNTEPLVTHNKNIFLEPIFIYKLSGK